MHKTTSEPLAQGYWPWTLLAMAAVIQSASYAWPGSDQVTWHAIVGLRFGEPQPHLQLFSAMLMLKVLTWARQWQQAAWWGWFFGLAQGLSATWWLYISMATYGNAPAWAAAFGVVALNSFLALYWAAMAAWLHRVKGLSGWTAPLAAAAAWVTLEWARASWFTGFPWGGPAIAHVDGLGFLAPVVGGLGVSALVAGAAAMVASQPWIGRQAFKPALMAAVLAITVTPHMPWSSWDLSQTQPLETTDVTLLQGNVDLEDKFDHQGGGAAALQWYADEISKPRTGITIAPETAVPWLPQDMDPLFWAELWKGLSQAQHAVVFGIPIGDEKRDLFNAAWFVRPQDAVYQLQQAAPSPQMPAAQRYLKAHLVPFGEYTPSILGWWTGVLGLPLNGFSAGALDQAAPVWNDQRWGIQICYEDLFGDELAARMWLTHPNVWINLSNIAWFGNTVAIPQHLNIARWRARELGRSTVRATNTGATAIVDHMGQVQAILPAHTRGVLQGQVEGRVGLTPYVRWAGQWGHWPWLVVAFWIIGLLEWRARAGTRPARRI